MEPKCHLHTELSHFQKIYPLIQYSLVDQWLHDFEFKSATQIIDLLSTYWTSFAFIRTHEKAHERIAYCEQWICPFVMLNFLCCSYYRKNIFRTGCPASEDSSSDCFLTSPCRHWLGSLPSVQRRPILGPSTAPSRTWRPSPKHPGARSRTWTYPTPSRSRLTLVFPKPYIKKPPSDFCIRSLIWYRFAL